MNVYPEALTPRATEIMVLPSGMSVEISTAQLLFKRWEGEFAGDTYGNKPLLKVDRSSRARLT
jgi:hypothetical protein